MNSHFSPKTVAPLGRGYEYFSGNYIGKLSNTANVSRQTVNTCACLFETMHYGELDIYSVKINGLLIIYR